MMNDVAQAQQKLAWLLQHFFCPPPDPDVIGSGCELRESALALQDLLRALEQAQQEIARLREERQ